MTAKSDAKLDSILHRPAKTRSLNRKLSAIAFRLLLVAIFAASICFVRPADAQGRSQLRTVHGSVLDQNNDPIANGIVYLYNKKTNTVRTYISEANGTYRFSGLDPNVDFEIHAEYKKAKSTRHSISSFDDRRDIEINLVINSK